MSTPPETTSPPVPSDVPGESAPAARRALALVLGAALIVGAVFLAYFPALRAGYIWDDDSYLTDNPVITDPDGLRKIWSGLTATPQFYPLVFTTFWLEHRLWGPNPAGYHAVNIALHALNSLLVWRILRRLSIPGAFIGAAIFAVHPVHVESVAWITERKNTLSAFFYLGAFLAYLRFAGLGTIRDGAAPPARPMYVVSIVLFAAALLSKTVTCSLPGALVLVLWWKREPWRWRDLLPLVPMFLMGLIAARTTTWVEQHHVLAKELDLGLSPLGRLLVAGRAVWFYLGRLVWPVDLVFIYPRWTVDPAVWWQWLYPLGGAAVIVTLWAVRRRIGRGPLVGALFFAGTLVPALGFIDVYPMRYSFVADHFQYLASLGLIALAGAALIRLLEPRPSTALGAWRAPDLTARTVGAAVILMAGLGSLAFRQCFIYRDSETLWRDTIARNPSAWIAHNNLGGLLLLSGRLEEGQKHLLRAVELNPSHGEALNNLALLYLNRGDPQRAVEFARRASVAAPSKIEVHIVGARALLAAKGYEEAAEWARTAIRLRPDVGAPYVILGAACLKLERPGDAIAPLEEATRLSAPDAGTLGALGDALAGVGRDQEAMKAYQDALALNRNSYNASCGLARLLAKQGRVPEALACARAAIAQYPSVPDGYAALAQILASQPDRLDDAAAHYETALRLDPDSRKSHVELGKIRSVQGRVSDAVRHFREALRIRPGDTEAGDLLDAQLKRIRPPP